MLWLLACSEQQSTFTPKPRGFHRIVLPEAAYVSLPDTLPYRFRYSANAQLIKDTSAYSEKYWYDIFYPNFSANLDIAYKKIENQAQFKDYINDSHKLVDKHHIKAYSIEQSVVKTPKGLTGIVFELSGDVPTQFQFYITDSVQHFLRVDLYFPTATHNDSLAPIIEYIKKDMIEMMNTTEWNKNFVKK